MPSIEESDCFLNPVLNSAFFINRNSKHVSIPQEGVEKAARLIYRNMKARKYSTAIWKQHPLNPKVADKSAVEWIFLVDLLNFSFWSDIDTVDSSAPHPDRYAVTFEGTSYTGYWSLCAAVNRALKEGIPITSPTFYGREATDDLLRHVFRSDTKEAMPLLEERIAVLREAGNILCENFEGQFLKCIEQANKSALKLLELIVQNFPCFRDEHCYMGRTVKFYKRAQILIADIWACFEEKDYGEFHDIGQLTMFADYRVPQALYHMGALQYSNHLLNILHNHIPLPLGSTEEIEIRGNSIWVVELIRRKILTKIRRDMARAKMRSGKRRRFPRFKVNSILLDFYIWDYAKETQSIEKIPCHRTRSIFY
ncbi:uncharacterized protein VTP21DRAFT_3631 [Calcarisporiella thermophila]|uniref:uncharacterized protein n=1 Tax=Calcarisporiella thermophila TaxID=911321 RepID=UPI0037435E4C